MIEPTIVEAVVESDNRIYHCNFYSDGVQPYISVGLGVQSEIPNMEGAISSNEKIIEFTKLKFYPNYIELRTESQLKIVKYNSSFIPNRDDISEYQVVGTIAPYQNFSCQLNETGEIQCTVNITDLNMKDVFKYPMQLQARRSSDVFEYLTVVDPLIIYSLYFCL